jgi:hypothetical protein
MCSQKRNITENMKKFEISYIVGGNNDLAALETEVSQNI